MKNAIFNELLKENPENLLNTGKGIADVLLNDANTLFFGTLIGIVPFDPGNNLRSYTIKDGTPTKSGLCLQKDSEFTETFSYYITQMKESGFLQHTYEKHVPQLFKKTIPVSVVSSPISLNGVVFPFAVLSLAITLAFVILLAEHILILYQCFV